MTGEPGTVSHRLRHCVDGQGHQWEYSDGSDPRGSYAKTCTKCHMYKGGNRGDIEAPAAGAPAAGGPTTGAPAPDVAH
jgi:hypothetical protein